MYVCAIRSADGKEFKVGCDCVGRVYQECAGTDAERAMRAIWDKAREPMRKAERARRQARAAAQADAAAAQLADEDVREILAAEPHPTLHMANRGATHLGERCLRGPGLNVERVCLMSRDQGEAMEADLIGKIHPTVTSGVSSSTPYERERLVVE